NVSRYFFAKASQVIGSSPRLAVEAVEFSFLSPLALAGVGQCGVRPQGEGPALAELDPLQGVAPGLAVLATLDPDLDELRNGQLGHGLALQCKDSTHHATHIVRR